MQITSYLLINFKYTVKFPDRDNRIMKTEMKIKKKVIESVRIRPDRGEVLKNKAYELSMKAKMTISESDIVNFLIDTYAEKVDIDKDELKLGK